MFGVASRNRLRRLARAVDPDYRLRRVPRQLRGALFALTHEVATPPAGNRAIAQAIRDGRPAAIGKIGNSELRIVLRRLAGRAAPYPDWLREEALVGPGIFPTDDRTLDRFSDVYLESLGSVDLLGVWYNHGEARVVAAAASRARFMELEALEPYLCEEPWSHALLGRRVAVVTPFARTVAAQYERRRAIWTAQPTPLPDFDLRVVPVPFSPALEPPRHATWFERYDAVAERLESKPFDVALVGAGGLSIPLCALARRLGRIGIHMGGGTQVLFGIQGRRFEDNPEIVRRMNEHWCRPLPEETPSANGLVENGAYW
ncbi:hypothetical protein [Azospirillum halopraeferens]|uniref:hypothetical protein n=1 Tax=Azospirillum halopraeferens TaxID=34010 RepID=UPI000415AECF|nr:hypothetical protein [Azospirillum halopraeferens]